jgi:hypothetical protein
MLDSFLKAVIACFPGAKIVIYLENFSTHGCVYVHEI